MILTYKRIEETFIIEPDIINSIVIEDENLFERFILDLYRQINKEEENFILSLDYEPCELHNSFDIISSPTELTYKKREIQKSLYSEIFNEMSISGLSETILELQSAIINKIGDINLTLDFEINYIDNLGINDILKYVDIKLSDPEGCFIEKFVDYSKNVKRFTGKNVFVLANCDAYLKEEEYKNLEKAMLYNEIYIVFIRNRQNIVKISQNEYIIDNDWCILH